MSQNINKLFNFGADPDQNLDTGVFNGIFTVAA